MEQMHSQINTFAPAEKRTYSVDEIKSILGISKRKAYDLCKTNCFKVVRAGSAIRISKAADRKRWYAKCCMNPLAKNAPVSCC